MGDVLRDHPEAVARWLADQPGAWGYLAGHGVMAARRALGRQLTEEERREVWSLLWHLLTSLRAAPNP